MNVPIAANVLGTIGAVGSPHPPTFSSNTVQICWSVQLIPQIIINYRRHSTEGLQRSMMLLWALAGVPLGVYNITSSFNVALLVQPQILTVLSLITWIQCFYYDDVSLVCFLWSFRGNAAPHHMWTELMSSRNGRKGSA